MKRTVEEPSVIESSKDLPSTMTVNNPITASGSVGRVQVSDAGYIDVRDEITYQIAKNYLRLMAKKLGIEEPNG